MRKQRGGAGWSSCPRLPRVVGERETRRKRKKRLLQDHHLCKAQRARPRRPRAPSPWLLRSGRRCVAHKVSLFHLFSPLHVSLRLDLAGRGPWPLIYLRVEREYSFYHYHYSRRVMSCFTAQIFCFKKVRFRQTAEARACRMQSVQWNNGRTLSTSFSWLCRRIGPAPDEIWSTQATKPRVFNPATDPAQTTTSNTALTYKILLRDEQIRRE